MKENYNCNNSITENDIIAEYVKTNFPNLIETVDYSVFRLNLVSKETNKAGKMLETAFKKLKNNMKNK